MNFSEDGPRVCLVEGVLYPGFTEGVVGGDYGERLARGA